MKKIYTIHVYKIFWNTNDDTYISSTKTHLIFKMKYLKCNCKKNNTPNINIAINKYGIDNFKYSLIKSYDVSSIDEQKKWEQYHIAILKPTIYPNKVYLNKKQRLIKQRNTKKIWINKNKDKLVKINKRYYVNNKQYIIDKNRIYASKNKESISARSKIYYQNNKNKILITQKKYRHKYKIEINYRIHNYINIHRELLSLFKDNILIKDRTIYYKKIKKYDNNNNNIFYKNHEKILIMHSKYYYKRHKNKQLEDTKIHTMRCNNQIHRTICNFYYVHDELLTIFQKNEKGLFIE